MASVGIVAEYNPFHNGHAYNISAARRVSGCENVIVCMSGSFVQRGEPACFDKFTRAKHALLGGADLVIEMPDILSCQSAERFALGGIRLLSATGMIDSIAFGSECGDIDALRQAASADIRSDSVKAALDGGVTYAKAISGALPGKASFAGSPNDILAIEYLRQITRLSPGVSVYAIPRVGPGHNSSEAESGFASASTVRAALSAGRIESVSDLVPKYVFNDIEVQMNGGAFPAALNNLSDAALYSLRCLGTDGISRLADVSEGLENLFFRHAYSCSDIDEMLSEVKSKRYTMARLKRIIIAAMLGSTKTLLHTAVNAPDTLYIRVLGIKRNKQYLLSELSEKALLPVVTSFADTRRLSPNAQRILAHTRTASLVRALACPIIKKTEDDFSHPLIIV